MAESYIICLNSTQIQQSASCASQPFFRVFWKQNLWLKLSYLKFSGAATLVRAFFHCSMSSMSLPWSRAQRAPGSPLLDRNALKYSRKDVHILSSLFTGKTPRSVVLWDFLVWRFQALKGPAGSLQDVQDANIGRTGGQTRGLQRTSFNSAELVWTESDW
jgi:hypothetical protein